jgi:hypothetical protein
VLEAQLKTAVRWAFKGLNSSNRMSLIVHEYFDRIMFRKIGVHFNDELDDFDIKCFKIIACEINKLEQKDLKKKK